jgi:hypothetical protein
LKGQKTVVQKKVKISKGELLSFKPTGRVIELYEVQNEFKLMSEACGNDPAFCSIRPCCSLL